MGKNKAQAHHTSTYFHTRRVSIKLSCFRSPTLAGARFGSHCVFEGKKNRYTSQLALLHVRTRHLPVAQRTRHPSSFMSPCRPSFFVLHDDNDNDLASTIYFFDSRWHVVGHAMGCPAICHEIPRQLAVHATACRGIPRGMRRKTSTCHDSFRAAAMLAPRHAPTRMPCIVHHVA